MWNVGNGRGRKDSILLFALVGILCQIMTYYVSAVKSGKTWAGGSVAGVRFEGSYD